MRKAWPILLLLAVLPALALHEGRTPSSAQRDFFQERCLDPTEPRNPYYAATLLSGLGLETRSPSVVAFRDTAGNEISDRWRLARLEDTGSVFGLAYDPLRGHLYAGAFHQYRIDFGPAGAGGIYRVDLETGEIVAWASLEAGEDHHGGTLRTPRTGIPDFDAIPLAGKVSLGDLEIDEAGEALYAMNLHDRRIHRFALPEGAPLGSFAIGSASEPWADNARPFGLAVTGGRLYHGVVDSREEPSLPGALRAYVYRSLPDGSEMREVARLDLDYGAPPHDWQPWLSEPLAERMATPPFPRPDGGQPLLADIEMDRGGSLALGLRNRVGDMYWPRFWGGDLLPARPANGRFEVPAPPEHFRDDAADDLEPLRGGLAVDPQAERVLAGGTVDRDFHTASVWAVRWFDRLTGEVRGPVDGREPLLDNETRGIGDLELLCAPAWTPSPPASSTPSATPTASPTSTPSASPTGTATPMPSPSATAELRPIYLPMTMREHCPPVWLDLYLALDVSTSMGRPDGSGRTKLAAALEGAAALLDMLSLGRGVPGDRAAVLGFNALAWVESPLTDDASALRSALARLPERSAQGTRLDLVLEAAARELPTLPTSGRQSIVLLLTDGLPNRVPTPEGGGRQEDTVLAAAGRLRAAGVRIYALGLGRGEDLDAALLEAIAGSPRRYRHAADAGALGALFRGIGAELVCGR